MDAATLEQPRTKFRFTPENARFFSSRGNDARKLKRERELSEIQAGREAIRTADQKREDIEKELQRILLMMKKTDDADTLQKLSGARARLFDEWQVLTGTPNPGSRRGRQDRPRPPEVHRSPIPTPQEKTN
jgi:hypothetical protein